MPDSNDRRSVLNSSPGTPSISDSDNRDARERIEQESPTPLAVAVPAGHFYSPIPSVDEVRKDADRLFSNVARTLPGIDFREDEQLRLLEIFSDRYYKEMPFGPLQSEAHRYYFENPMFSYADALSLHFMVRHFAPKRVIEVGSGFSSAVTLDTNERFFDGRIQAIFVEPYTDRLMSLLRKDDEQRSTIIRSRVQDVDLGLFSMLGENDILFIDSSHVSKIGSDVNRLVFEVLPSLAPGVLIHFHDIFLPSEYPSQWIYDGCAWNEAYLLRAFLQFNNRFEIVLMNNFMGRFHEAFLADRMPLFMKNIGGSLWIRKTA